MKITLRNLTKRFPARGKRAQGEVTAVSDLTFEAPDGELVGLLGPSGCGKSTTLNMICGLEKPTEGRIFFGDEDVTDLPPELRGVGMVFQNYALYPHLTVLQNIVFPLENLKGKDKLTRQQMNERALGAAKLVQIETLLDRRPRELSGGQQQRVAIARALSLKPDILCFDEPTSALDPELTGEVLRVIRGLAERETTMIIVTHEMAFARDVADEAIFMDGGRIVEQGAARQVIDDPQNERTRRFLARYAENGGD